MVSPRRTRSKSTTTKQQADVNGNTVLTQLNTKNAGSKRRNNNSKVSSAVHDNNNSVITSSQPSTTNKKNVKKRPLADDDVVASEDDDWLQVDKDVSPNKRPRAVVSNKPKPKSPIKASMSSDGESDWEDVEPAPLLLSDTATDQPSTSTAPASETIVLKVEPKKEKSKCEQYVQTFLRREINRYRKDLLIDIHQAHLLCFIARLRHLSSVCNNNYVRALALSIIPQGFIDEFMTDQFTLSTVIKWVKWFHSAFTFKPLLDQPRALMQINYEMMFQFRVVTSYMHLTSVFVTLSRVVNLPVRFVCSVHPFTMKMEQKPDDKEPNIFDMDSKPKKKKMAKSQDQVVDKLEHSFTNAAVKKRSEKKDNNKPKYKSGVVFHPDDLKKAPKCDYWAEVYLKCEERWICINLNSLPAKLVHVDKSEQIERYATQPVHYVLACDNDGSIRDVTWRYASKYLTPAVRRLRTDDQWWNDTLHLFTGKRNRLRDRLEDMQRDDKLKSAPLPTIVSEYKNHPLYVLKRDLLKFEALYPANTPVIGRCRNEEVYARSAVHTLHNKDGWLKLARVIKPNEEPYKIVKARPKMGVPKSEQEDRPCPLFGLWQTEPFVPKPPVNGKIPRNEFGNVEMFQACMQPPGTVHLTLPRLLDVAKKLDIDCAPVMTGWEFRSRRTVPVIDGYLVCTEHEHTLVAAWNEEEARREQRIKRRAQERAIENWYRFAKGLLLRSRVKKKFLKQQPKLKSDPKQVGHELTGRGHESDTDESSCDGDEADGKQSTVAQDNARIQWPQNKHQFTL